MLTQTQLAKIFGKDVHFISKFLKDCGFKDKKSNKPIKSLITQGLVKFDRTWLWDESLITSLESFGLQRLRKYKIKNEVAGTKIYTDGSRGSYAAVLMEFGNKSYIAGTSDDLLDNNRAELYAIYAALTVVSSDCTIYTDSKYAIAAIKKPQNQTKNLDILADIGIISKSKGVKFNCVWIKAHVGIIGNDEVDSLCTFVKQIKL